MAFCTQCGGSIADDAAFCTSCGAANQRIESSDESASAITPDEELEPDSASSTATDSSPRIPAPVCASCGASIEPGAEFCIPCGTATAAVAGSVVASTPPSGHEHSADAHTTTLPSADEAHECETCGEPLESGALFCTSCGAGASGTPTPPPPPSSAETVAPLSEPGPRRNRWLIPVLVAAIAFVLVAVGVTWAATRLGGDDVATAPTTTTPPSSTTQAQTTTVPTTTTLKPTTTAPATTTTSTPTTTAGAGNNSGEDIKIGMAYDVGGRGDNPFNESAATGLDKAVTDYGIETQGLEPTAGGENREENLRLLAESGSNLVFAIGVPFSGAVHRVAPDFPETTFAIVDTVVDAPNIASLVFAYHEGSALVGAAAALKSQTGAIGFIGAVDIAFINEFEAGYRFGAEQINPSIEVVAQYVSEPPDFSGFSDPIRGREIALAMYGQGVDVIYHTAGESGLGIFTAAKDFSETTGTKVWGIGVGTDQYTTVGDDMKEYVLTSMLERIDVAVYTTITNLVSGRDQFGLVVFDLSADGVGYSTSGGFVDDITDQLDQMRRTIVNGELVVPDSIS